MARKRFTAEQIIMKLDSYNPFRRITCGVDDARVNPGCQHASPFSKRRTYRCSLVGGGASHLIRRIQQQREPEWDFGLSR